MKITKRQLRRIITEACGLAQGPAPEEHSHPHESSADVPVPQDYEAVRDVLEQNQDLVDMSIKVVMDAAGVGCERSSAQAIIDHLQDMVGGGGVTPEPIVPQQSRQLPTMIIKGPGF